MELEDFDKSTVELVPKNVIIPKKIELPEYLVESSEIRLEYVNNMAKSDGVQLKFFIKREIFGEVLTTFLPSTLLMLIVYATAHFKPKFFEAALSVNLGVMFVMTTLFVSVMERLPRTSYLRMVDIWLIYGQILPFVEVILLTFMTMRREELSIRKIQVSK